MRLELKKFQLQLLERLRNLLVLLGGDRQRLKSKTNQANSGHTAEKLATMFTTTCRSRGKRAVDDPSRNEDDPTRTNFKSATKDTWSREILSLEDSMIGELLYNAQDAHMWLLDSGATFHVTPNIECFSNYSTDTSGTVRLGNGQECKIARTGEVPIKLPNGNTITLHRVRHIPDLRSLVSIGMLLRTGTERLWMSRHCSSASKINPNNIISRVGFIASK